MFSNKIFRFGKSIWMRNMDAVDLILCLFRLFVIILISVTSPPPCFLQTIDQFEYDGCDNCESYLQMKGNREMVYECTSSSFDG